MQLRWKLIMTLSLLYALLMCMAGVTFWEFFGVSRNITLAENEYLTLRDTYEVSNRLVVSQSMLDPRYPRLMEARGHLKSALDRMQEFLKRLEGRSFGSPERDQWMKAHAQKVATEIEFMINSVESNIGNPSSDNMQLIILNLGTLVNELNLMAAETERGVKLAKEDAAQRRETATYVILGFTGVIIFGALLVSVWQYRTVMRPMYRLKHGVERLRSGDFSAKLEVRGQDEFAELSDNFNLMAAELDELYQSLEDKVKKQSAELARSERLASTGFLAAGVAHEINNPLGVITGYSELSLSKLSKGITRHSVSEAEEALLVIRDEAYRCKGIIEKLLNMSRVGDDSKDEVDLNRLVNEVITLIPALKRFSDRDLVIDASDNEIRIWGNGGELKQVLLNLIVNALDAVEPNEGRVNVQVKSDDYLAYVHVIDNGKGMKQDTLERIFEPFFTTKKGRVEGSGSGLGLSITYAIIQDHGGEIRAESDGLGKGSEFIVQWPLYKQEPEDHD